MQSHFDYRHFDYRHFDYQSLPPRSHIGSSLFRKINWLPTGDRVECCFANTIFKYSNRIVPGYIHEMFQPSLCRYSTRLQMTLGMPLRKTNTGQKSLSFLGPKIWSERNPSIKYRLLLCKL